MLTIKAHLVRYCYESSLIPLYVMCCCVFRHT